MVSRILPDREFVNRASDVFPDSFQRTLVRSTGALVRVEALLGRNVVSTRYGDTSFEFRYVDGQSRLYFEQSGRVEDGRTAEGVPLSLCDLPDEYDVAIDVGAHLGLYSIILGALNDVELVCFEPSERNARILRENLEHNSIDADVHEKVVSDADGYTSFYETFWSAANTTSPREDHVRTRPFRSTRKETTRLSSVLNGYEGATVFLKIDAEGEEFAILHDVVARTNLGGVTAVVELHLDRYERSLDDVHAFLDDAGFSYAKIPGAAEQPTHKRYVVSTFEPVEEFLAE